MAGASVAACPRGWLHGPGVHTVLFSSPPQWHSLSREEQAKYYELARKERQLHSQLYPTWSARDNYVSAAPGFMAGGAGGGSNGAESPGLLRGTASPVSPRGLVPRQTWKHPLSCCIGALSYFSGQEKEEEARKAGPAAKPRHGE